MLPPYPALKNKFAEMLARFRNNAYLCSVKKTKRGAKQQPRNKAAYFVPVP